MDGRSERTNVGVLGVIQRGNRILDFLLEIWYNIHTGWEITAPLETQRRQEMTKKIVDTIRRTGNAKSPSRYIEVIQGSGKHADRQVLSTAITKVQGDEQFRHGALRIPIEQYAFKVGTKTVERFADAAALVLRKHQVVLANPEADDVQEYVKRAYAIINGTDKLRVLKDIPKDFKPAVAA